MMEVAVKKHESKWEKFRLNPKENVLMAEVLGAGHSSPKLPGGGEFPRTAETGKTGGTATSNRASEMAPPPVLPTPTTLLAHFA